ncbi:hypothetical protein [Stenotrophomonas rhizophila]|jgi:hypothetical protein|uniref:hypothetical protein n=1 Tax=Stenotrophomonas rhizophila TaxID=216778 RepID=UPI00081C3031|nr:hypothetical protein [Stenotrophomonas rhizophila]AOA72445.1 hypothetical protein BAY15_2011 [Stenotrophomonas rhizophila]
MSSPCTASRLVAHSFCESLEAGDGTDAVTSALQWTGAAIQAHDGPATCRHYWELRSIPAGRLQGSFGEPADRVRAWHWLAEVLAAAQVDSVHVLDRHTPRHRLMRGQSQGRRFETVLLDGYTPPRWLREHVAGQRGFKATQRAYMHPVWDHLAYRAPCFPERDSWLTQQLKLHRILRIEPGDELHAIELGLIPDEREWDSKSTLDLHFSRFMSLDGLLLLLLLYREAQDVGHRSQAAMFRSLLYALGSEWPRHYRYHNEASDTWRFLLETRIVDWAPRFQPSQAAITRAEEELLQEHDRLAKLAKTKPHTPPGQLKKGRSERRWRRKVLIRACCVHYDGFSSYRNVDYRDADPLYEWLAAHREHIAQHRSRAIEVLIMDPEDAATSRLDPLVMPAALYAQRCRPPISESEWIVFGNKSIFDVIPVVSE